MKQSGYSPDAYVQMAIQLAIYRLFGKQAATYEASQVRIFLHGRTETTRSVSQGSEKFVKAMGLRRKYDEDNIEARTKKLAFLREAVALHVKYLKHAANGYGVDRHFFGLSMLLDDANERPSLFSNPVYARSKHWRVSTSCLPNSPGFGEVVPDGVGIGYEVKTNSCIFTITARKEHNWTETLSHFIEEALIEMRFLNDMESKPNSKL